jgi:hypothetical protein
MAFGNTWLVGVIAVTPRMCVIIVLVSSVSSVAEFSPRFIDGSISTSNGTLRIARATPRAAFASGSDVRD